MNKVDIIIATANFMEGMAAMSEKFEVESNLKFAAEELKFLARNLCGGGYICPGGPSCTSDHK